MATLKELQLSHPIGTKFRKNDWLSGCYVVFDGLDWRHSDGEVMNDDQWRAWNPSHTDWTLYTEPMRRKAYVAMFQTGGIHLFPDYSTASCYNGHGQILAGKWVELVEGEGVEK